MPVDTDYCEPIDSGLLKKDGIIVSAGGGLQWELNRIFIRHPANTLLFNTGIASILGGKLNADAPSHGQHLDADLTASFVNTRTQAVHKHHAGYIYISYADLIQFRAGSVLRPLPLRPGY
jgi:hypothetical protein